MLVPACLCNAETLPNQPFCTLFSHLSAVSDRKKASPARVESSVSVRSNNGCATEKKNFETSRSDDVEHQSEVEDDARGVVKQEVFAAEAGAIVRGEGVEVMMTSSIM